ncbi:MAG: hypothetical protein NTU94_09130 [Planctomycetota bacterium]|nr:hypothetical protein [Planctomycetota bacterium]
MRTVCGTFLVALAMLAGPALAGTGALVDASGEFGPAPDSTAKEFPFEVAKRKPPPRPRAAVYRNPIPGPCRPG